MVEAYWKKTRSNTIIDPKHFRNGLIVWVAGANGREARVCRGDGESAQLLTLEANREERRRRAAENARKNPGRRKRVNLRDRVSFGPYMGIFAH